MQIICRGSIQEGLGHLFRTRTFAKQAAGFHEVEVVALVEPELEGTLGEVACPVHCVREDRDAIPLIQNFAPDVVVFDTTRIEPSVFQAATEATVLKVSISPVFNRMDAVDVLFTRSRRNAPLPGVEIFGGLQFAIFNDRCQAIDDTTFERNLALPELPVAVCMGGTDAANKTLAVIRALTEMPEPTTALVLLGEGYAHCYNTLVDAVRGDARHEIVLAKTNRSMWRVMSNCAVGIMAGGLTAAEAVYAGLPTINIFNQPEHTAMLEELFEAGVCLNGGLFSERALTTTIKTLRRLHQNREELRQMRQRGRGLADLHGPMRVLREIEQCLLRKALRQVRRAPTAEVVCA
jgi:spore coat polysaccharide biosynthesis predicted glycosyltransferase SpsG